MTNETNNKKYELVVNDTIVAEEGLTLYRIKALRDFGNVSKGDLVGYVQSEENLSHDGDCWIYDEAKAYQNSKVLDDATMFDKSELKDNAFIGRRTTLENYAYVSGNSELFGNIRVIDSVRILENVSIESPNALISGTTCLYGNTEIKGEVVLSEDNEIGDNTFIFGGERMHLQNVYIKGNVSLIGNIVLGGCVVINGDVELNGSIWVHGVASILGNDIKLNSASDIVLVRLPLDYDVNLTYISQSGMFAWRNGIYTIDELFDALKNRNESTEALERSRKLLDTIRGLFQ